MSQQATYKQGPMVQVTLSNGSGSALNVGDLVQDDGSNDIDALADAGGGTNALLGICHEDIASGDTGYVEIPLGAVYEVSLATGFDPSYLDAIYPAGSGEFDAGAASDVASGYIVDTNPSSGGTARAVLLTEKMNPPAHA